MHRPPSRRHRCHKPGMQTEHCRRPGFGCNGRTPSPLCAARPAATGFRQFRIDPVQQHDRGDQQFASGYAHDRGDDADAEPGKHTGDGLRGRRRASAEIAPACSAANMTAGCMPWNHPRAPTASPNSVAPASPAGVNPDPKSDRTARVPSTEPASRAATIRPAWAVIPRPDAHASSTAYPTRATPTVAVTVVPGFASWSDHQRFAAASVAPDAAEKAALRSKKRSRAVRRKTWDWMALARLGVPVSM